MNSKFYTLPDFDKIIDLEKFANKSGSGISYDKLIGCWNLRYVWKKGTEKIDNISSSFLQILRKGYAVFTWLWFAVHSRLSCIFYSK